jgi:hypothetical protein
MVLSIIFLEDKHKIVLHLSIFYEYQQFFQHRVFYFLSAVALVMRPFKFNFPVYTYQEILLTNFLCTFLVVSLSLLQSLNPNIEFERKR